MSKANIGGMAIASGLMTGVGGIKTSVGTAGANTTSNTTGVSTGIAFALGVGEYLITCILGVTTAATTTAPRFAFLASGGLVAGSFDMQADVSTTAVASQPSNSNTLGTFTAATTGQGATQRPVVITARVRVTTAGTVTLQLQSEVSGSAVTMVEGCGYAVRVA
ncbi:MAG: hypothetical protein IT464_12710 [Planctomycetes bacterium]|nr:hypothetical protein [Planctomycetota bacterium]